MRIKIRICIAKLKLQNVIVFNYGQLLTIKALNMYNRYNRYNCCRYKFVI